MFKYCVADISAYFFAFLDEGFLLRRELMLVSTLLSFAFGEIHLP